MLYRFAAAVIVQNEDIAGWFRQSVATRRLLIIPNAVRSQSFLDTTSARIDEPIILGIGRLARQKGFDLLLPAFASTGLADQGWRVVILGEGEDRKALAQLSDDLGLSGSVEMPGHVSDVAGWIARSRIFALPSRYEGFPNALLEAMHLGTASVSFDCPSGPRDLIEHGVNGLLIQAEDVARSPRRSGNWRWTSRFGNGWRARPPKFRKPSRKIASTGFGPKRWTQPTRGACKPWHFEPMLFRPSR